ncbi:hypothetical protein ACOSQ2_012177 [Xanthoceras sorbifolium]
MDDGGEGTSWAGNIFRKFETLCCEVDEVVKQEIENVDNQLQTFRANLVQFCSNLMEEESSQFLEEETESNIDIVDSGASNIGIDEDHYKKESCDANNFLSSSSVAPTGEVQLDSSVEQNANSKTYEKFEVSDKENHVSVELEYEMLDVAASKEEDLALESDDVAGCDYSVETEESRNLENTSTVYISSPMRSCNSVNVVESSDIDVLNTEGTPADASTKSFEGILKNDVVTKQEMETNPSFDKVNSDVKLIDQAAIGHISEERWKKLKKRWFGLLRKSKQEKARPQLSEKSETDHESDGVIQKSEELKTNQDSDWVIV